MITTVISATLIGAAIFSIGYGLITKDNETRQAGITIGLIFGAIGLVLLAVKSHKQVDSQEVSIPVKFGQAGEPVSAGTVWAAPWTVWHDLPAREVTINFEGNSEKAQQNGTDDITMQTEGGGGFDMDARVRYQIDKERASEVWRKLGTGYEQNVVIPASRECIRDASVGISLVDAITSGRTTIAQSANECLVKKVEDVYGINIIGVELGGTKVPDSVQEAINAKQTAEQSVQQAQDEAKRRRIEAAAKSDAAQIETCGAVEVDGVLRPDPECRGALTDRYLELQRIENIGKADTIVVVDEDAVGSGSQVLVDAKGAAG